MNFTNLTYSEVSNISTTLGSAASTMETLLNEIVTLLNNVGNEDTWSGTAASEAKSTIDELSKKFPEFYAAVDSMSKYLANVVANYQAADRAVTSN